MEKDKLLSNEKKLRERADYLKQRLSFLVDISIILSSSLEYATTLKTVAKTVVSVLADICAIDLIDDFGNIKRVEASYSDTIKIKTVSE